ncbi:MAG TPA: hypothetical protein VJT15_23135 [Pyrinomonadaceae bacterium]|nr:hypothetical protein [Pyrinomonadaceae bacterium]
MSNRPASTVLGLFVALLTAVCCLSIYAQSGRRKVQPPAVAPVPTPTPEPTPEPSPKKSENQHMIMVVPGDRGASISLYPFSFTEAATAGCADRLSKHDAASVTVSRPLTRGEAINKAKSGKSYVVLIELREDRMAGQSQEYVELEVEYVVFGPGNAKVLTSGRTYERSNRKGPLVVGPRGRGATLPSYREELLHRAGEDAGERILKALHLDSLPRQVNRATKRHKRGSQKAQKRT